MSKQCKIADLPQKVKPAITKYEKRKWRKALNDYLLEQANTVGATNGWCVCGNMNYCDYCERTDKGCYKAIKQSARKLGVRLDYKNYDFEKLLQELEE